MLGERVGVLAAAGGAPWEVAALQAIAGAPARTVLLKRCMDMPDLLAAASTGQARAAVVDAEIPGLDTEGMEHLLGCGIGVVLVVDGDEAVRVTGMFRTVRRDQLSALPDLLVTAAEAAARQPGREPEEPVARSQCVPGTGPLEAADVQHESGPAGRLIAVWGPTGAPGRTTVAVTLAAELARRGHETLLVDADAYGGAVAQHLGVLDEVSGLLGAARLANTGRLDVQGLAGVARSVSPQLRVLTGLPRADRWAEVRPPAFDALLESARGLAAFVVVDLGFSLELEAAAYGSSAPQRNHMTLAALESADEVVVVGSADPVGLARLARGLVELPDVVPVARTRVAVNRMRPTLGWGESEVRAMVTGFLTPTSMHVLPHDPAATDRALVAGVPVGTAGRSALADAVSRLADSVDGVDGSAEPRSSSGRGRGGRLRRRRAGGVR